MDKITPIQPPATLHWVPGSRSPPLETSTDVHVHRLKANEVVGRHSSSTLRIVDPEMSKIHAKITCKDQAYWIEDAGSSNGTLVNNSLIDSPILLSHNDVICLGATYFSFRMPLADSQLYSSITCDSDSKHCIKGELEHLQGEEPIFASSADFSDMESLKRDYDVLRLVQELGRKSRCSDDPDSAIQMILDHTTQSLFDMLSPDLALVMLQAPNETELTPRAIRMKQTEEFNVSWTIIRRAMESRTSLMISDASGVDLSQSFHNAKLTAALCSPLVTAVTGVIGVVYVVSKKSSAAFDMNSLKIVKSVAVQVASLIESRWMVQKSAEENRMRYELERFLPPRVVADIILSGQGHNTVQRSARKVPNVSVLYADVRGFTGLAETLDSNEVVTLLNEWYDLLVGIVTRFSGVVDKAIGDCLMVTFGTIDGEIESTVNAVKCAYEWRQSIRKLNRMRLAEGQPPFPTGIGLNCGPCTVGYVGAMSRLEYTVIGDTVNVASRLCAMAKADQVLLSEQTWELVASRIQARFIGKHVVKGKTIELGVYELLAIVPRSKAMKELVGAKTLIRE